MLRFVRGSADTCILCVVSVHREVARIVVPLVVESRTSNTFQDRIRNCVKQRGHGVTIETNVALCKRISEIKIVPVKGDPGEDRVFDEFMDAGEAVVPCLIKKVVDSTKVHGCPICPGYAGIEQRIGDVAFFLLLHLKDVNANQFLPDSLQKEYKAQGIYTYFKYVQQPANRRRVQERLLTWYQNNYPRQS